MMYKVITRHSYYRGMVGELKETINAHECLWFKIEGIWFKERELEYLK